MKYTLKIVADTNDADYVTSLNTVTETQLEELKPLIKAIKAFKPYTTKKKDGMGSFDWKHESNFPYGECCREDLGEKTVEELYKDHADVLEMFIDLMPHGEYGIHTIKSVEVTPEIKWTKLI